MLVAICLHESTPKRSTRAIEPLSDGVKAAGWSRFGCVRLSYRVFEVGQEPLILACVPRYDSKQRRRFIQLGAYNLQTVMDIVCCRNDKCAQDEPERSCASNTNRRTDTSLDAERYLQEGGCRQCKSVRRRLMATSEREDARPDRRGSSEQPNRSDAPLQQNGIVAQLYEDRFVAR